VNGAKSSSFFEETSLRHPTQFLCFARNPNPDREAQPSPARHTHPVVSPFALRIGKKLEAVAQIQ
jgi:hypothetical protein